MNFYVDTKNNEWLLHDRTGKVFFILKLKYREYYTSQLDEYIPIKNEIKDWLIDELKNGLNDSYDYSLIKRMFRKIKLENLLNKENNA